VRKAASACVITSSPYKNDLATSSSSSSSKSKQIPRKTRTKSKLSFVNNLISNPKKSINQRHQNNAGYISITSDSTDILNISGSSDLDVDPGQLVPDSNDAICMFCNGMFSNDKRGELWIQCLMCNMWAHTKCAGPESDHYICDFC
jgi:hypothetical protein